MKWPWSPAPIDPKAHPWKQASQRQIQEHSGKSGDVLRHRANQEGKDRVHSNKAEAAKEQKIARSKAQANARKNAEIANRALDQLAATVRTGKSPGKIRAARGRAKKAGASKKAIKNALKAKK